MANYIAQANCNYIKAVSIARGEIDKVCDWIEAKGYDAAAIMNEAGNHGDTFRHYQKGKIAYSDLLRIFNFMQGFYYGISRGTDYQNKVAE